MRSILISTVVAALSWPACSETTVVDGDVSWPEGDWKVTFDSSGTGDAPAADKEGRADCLPGDGSHPDDGSGAADHGGNPQWVPTSCLDGCGDDGLCIETRDGALCASPCGQDVPCADGFTCMDLPEGSFCVALDARLCMPCRFDSQCWPPSLGTGYKCASFGAGKGMFCTITCSDYIPCPGGYVCEDRGFGPACYPEDDTCSCSPLAVALHASTDCYSVSPFGTCNGVVVCTGSKAAVCTAPIPAGEVCNGKDDDCSGQTDEGYQDSNGNGLADCFENSGEEIGDSDNDGDPDNTDCAQFDPLVHNAALEMCNGQDDNCTGVADEGYPDSDGDGLADCIDPIEEPVVTDADGDGTPDEQDCAPDDPEIHPGAMEVCNGKDDACDGAPEPEGASGCIPFHKDGDGDGSGAAETKCLCGPAAPYTAENGGDCNDSDAAIKPGAQEVCNGKDDDCDGSADPPGLCEPTHKVCVDPGDGGDQPGAVGIVTEKNVNLAMGLKLRDWLQKDSGNTGGGGSWEVLMTRDKDATVSMEARVSYANSNGAERFLSVHNNSCGYCGGHGTETWIKPGAQGEAQTLAGKVQAQLIAKLGLKDRGVKSGDYYVLTHTNMPAAMAFPGFVDDAGDVAVINSGSGQDNAGLAMLMGIQQAFGLGAFKP